MINRFLRGKGYSIISRMSFTEGSESLNIDIICLNKGIRGNYRVRAWRSLYICSEDIGLGLTQLFQVWRALGLQIKHLMSEQVD